MKHGDLDILPEEYKEARQILRLLDKLLQLRRLCGPLSRLCVGNRLIGDDLGESFTESLMLLFTDHAEKHKS